MKTPVRTHAQRALRVAALAFSLVAVMAALLFFSPSTRALAESLIRQFGGYTFVQGTPQPDVIKEDGAEKAGPEQEATLRAEKQRMNNQPPAQESASGKPEAHSAADAAAASQFAGFTVLAPAYVPDGYIPERLDTQDGNRGWTIVHENGGVAARFNYQNPADNGFLVVEELKYEQGRPRTVERPQIVDTTVRGQPGVWMPDNGGKSTLAWEENGITYLVVSSALSLDESMKVAESLGK